MKISVVGAGNAGCFTALYAAWHGRKKDLEVELIYNPEIKPERVGQATLLDPPKLLWAAMGFNWYHNPIHGTLKSGILYEGWGKENDEVFHPFPPHSMAMHYCPWEMQKAVLESGQFKVIEDEVDPKDVDADYVFDCRGKPKDFTEYDELTNPINACILAKPNSWWRVEDPWWSRHVATPDGWMFVIPTHPDSPSHEYCIGYCYNKDITSREEATNNFYGQYDVHIKKYVEFKNYVAKSPVVDGRILLNGNRLFFLEPLESSSTQTYIEWVRYFINSVVTGEDSLRSSSYKILRYIRQVENFVLWHYQFGSKYDTPFWEYAKTLSFKDNVFDELLEYSKRADHKDIVPISYGGSTSDEMAYGQWNPHSFKIWYDGMTRA